MKRDGFHDDHHGCDDLRHYLAFLGVVHRGDAEICYVNTEYNTLVSSKQRLYFIKDNDARIT